MNEILDIDRVSSDGNSCFCLCSNKFVKFLVSFM